MAANVQPRLGDLRELRIGMATGDLPDLSRDLSAEPGVVEIDVAAAAELAAAIEDDMPPGLVPYSPLEHELLQQAEKCAAGDKGQPPRRELVSVALREAERHRAWRDHAERRAVALQQQVTALESAAKSARTTRRGLIVINAELLAFAAAHFGCAMDSDVVLAKIRATRPSLANAMREVGPTVAGETLPRGSRV